MKEHGHDFKRVVVLQNCMGLIKDEPDSGSESYVTTFDDGTEECNIKVEEANVKVEVSSVIFEESNIEVEEADIKIENAVDIKEENPEVITVLPVKSEPEVSEWSLCLRQQQFMFPRSFTATKRELLKLHFNCLYVCTMHFV
jgi:hypothetical protein